jgi:hypothetical protein
MQFLADCRGELPAAPKPEVPRYAGFSAKKKGLENIQALLIGGVCGLVKNRLTRVVLAGAESCG